MLDKHALLRDGIRGQAVVIEASLDISRQGDVADVGKWVSQGDSSPEFAEAQANIMVGS
jgi:hypothetical protein